MPCNVRSDCSQVNPGPGFYGQGGGYNRHARATEAGQRIFPGLGGADLAKACAKYLACTIPDIQALDVSGRQLFVGLMNQGEGYESGSGPAPWAGWFNNVIGVIEGFGDQGVIKPGSWYSWSDAGTLEAIESGLAEHLAHEVGIASPGERAYGNTESADPAVDAWQAFFDRAVASPGDTSGLEKLWGAAEKAAVHWSAAYADTMTPRPRGATTFVKVGDVYRDALQTGDFSAVRTIGAEGKSHDFCLSSAACTWFFKYASDLRYGDETFAPYSEPELFRESVNDAFHVAGDESSP